MYNFNGQNNKKLQYAGRKERRTIKDNLRDW